MVREAELKIFVHKHWDYGIAEIVRMAEARFGDCRVAVLDIIKGFMVVR
jgi:hypothetical protein